MIHKYAHLTDELLKKNIRPSQQRLKILEYFYLNKNHPTVEDIYSVLKPQMPTLTKATIYNTLKVFVKNKLVEEVLIEGNEVRYDLISNSHGHFKCFECGKIYDFKIDIDGLAVSGLNDFQINDKSVYFNGVCPDCLKKSAAKR